jgi:O-acetyl-ADP-ribose deacetylase (regulator of RNase III)
MKIILTSVDDELDNAWKRWCGEFDFVTIYKGSILDVSCDAVVSPANSFGFMDGGIDMIYSQFFGWHVQDCLQKLIAEKHHGELLVGTAEVVETDNEHIPFVIAAPTMRVPMILKDSVNPYLAARAVFHLIKNGIFSQGKFAGERITDVIQTIAFPGLGTGVGRIGPNTCAWQMRAAILHVILGQRSYPKTFAHAQAEHQKLYTDRVRDLQLET